MIRNPLADDLDHVLALTEGLWDELRGRRLFVTGGTGYFGCWLLESFAWANERLSLGASLLALTRDPDAFRSKAPHLAADPAISFHQGDVRSFAFPDGEFSHVIHAATQASAKLNTEDPLLMLDTIVQGTRRVLDFAVHCGAGKFLLTSSGAVYGRQPSDMTHMPEEYCGGPDLMDPDAAYAEGKRLAEFLCAAYAQKHSLEAKIARGFACVGPHLPLDAHFAIGNFIRDALRGGPIVVKGDGTPYRSYLYAADVAVWLWTILLRGQSCRPYNMGSEAEVTVGQLATTVAETVGTGAEVRILKPPSPGAPAGRFVPSVRRARDELGLEPRVGLRDALSRTTRWVQRVTT